MGYGTGPAYPSAPGYGWSDPVGPGPGVSAGLGPRFAARVLDILIVCIPLIILEVVVMSAIASSTHRTMNEVSARDNGMWLLLWYSAWAGYEIGLIASRGATLGKQIMRIKVVREVDGGLPRPGSAIVRWMLPAVGWFLCVLPGVLVYLSPVFDGSGRGQGWHDRAAGTLVVQS